MMTSDDGSTLHYVALFVFMLTFTLFLLFIICPLHSTLLVRNKEIGLPLLGSW